MLEVLVFLIIIVVFGVLPAIWFLNKKEKPLNDSKPNIIFVILTLSLVFINSIVCYVAVKSSIAYVLGMVYTLPLMFIAVSSLFKNSRNWRSRVKVIFYSSIWVSLALFGSVVSKVQASVQ